MPEKEENYAKAYIVTSEFLANHKREHYELHGDECTCCIQPFVTFSDIYNEAEPVRRGHWNNGYIENEDGSVTQIDYDCSICGLANDIKTNYCPNCGAKMDEK